MHSGNDRAFKVTQLYKERENARCVARCEHTSYPCISELKYISVLNEHVAVERGELFFTELGRPGKIIRPVYNIVVYSADIGCSTAECLEFEQLHVFTGAIPSECAV